MRNSLGKTLDFTLAHEGGYSSNRADPGNWTGGRIGAGQLVGTKYGISAPLLCRDRGTVSAQQVKTLTTDDFRQMAQRYFWNPNRCDQLPVGLDALVFDHGFNTGGTHSVRLLQQVVGVEPDGVIGPDTLRAISTVRLADAGRYCTAGQITALQQRLGCPTTGLLDAQTLGTIERRGRRIDLLCYAVSGQQFSDYRSKSQFSTFGAGWLRRARERLQLALNLLDTQTAAGPAAIS